MSDKLHELREIIGQQNIQLIQSQRMVSVLRNKMVIEFNDGCGTIEMRHMFDNPGYSETQLKTLFAGYIVSCLGDTHGLDVICEWSWDRELEELNLYENLLYDEQYELYLLSLVYKGITAANGEFSWHRKTMQMYHVQCYEWELGAS